jgi:sortase A
MTDVETRRAVVVEQAPASFLSRLRAGPARSPRPERSPLPASTALVLWIVGTLSALALWGVVFPVVVGTLQEEHSQQELFARLRSQLAQATAPLGPTALGKPVALIDLPGAGLRNAVVVEGTSTQELQTGPGHRRDTVLPGQAGTSVLFGKSVTFGAPFQHLRDLRAGDPLSVTTGQGTFTYTVERVRRPGDPLSPALTRGQGRLVLGTAEGRGWRNRVAPTSLVYVDALLKGLGQPSPGGRLSTVPRDERPFQSMTDPLLALVFWLQGLVLVVVGASLLRARWGRWQSWAATTPVVLAVIVGASGTATRLLPNLL